jgi:hypothetical protein
MTGRALLAALVLPLALVGCAGGFGHPITGPVDKIAPCPAYNGQPALGPAQVVRLKASPQTIHVHTQSLIQAVSIRPRDGIDASRWHLVVVSGGKHICHDTDNYGPTVLAELDRTSAGTVVLNATDDSDHQSRMTLIFP